MAQIQKFKRSDYVKNELIITIEELKNVSVSKNETKEKTKHPTITHIAKV